MRAESLDYLCISFSWGNALAESCPSFSLSFHLSLHGEHDFTWVCMGGFFLFCLCMVLTCLYMGIAWRGGWIAVSYRWLGPSRGMSLHGFWSLHGFVNVVGLFCYPKACLVFVSFAWVLHGEWVLHGNLSFACWKWFSRDSIVFFCLGKISMARLLWPTMWIAWVVWSMLGVLWPLAL